MSDQRDIPVLTLTETLNQYLMAAFNESRKYYANYLNIAKWAWKDLLFNTLWSAKHKYVQVDKSSFPYSIEKPKDMIRFFHVSLPDDCNNMQTFSENEYMNVLPAPKLASTCSQHKTCACEDSLCNAIGSIAVRVKDVWIDDQVYTEKIWNKKLNNGNFLEVREVPVKVYDRQLPQTYTVEIDYQEKLICTLEVNECGCVLPTEKNKTLIITACGCFFSCQEPTCNTGISATKNKFGKLKIEGNKIFLETDADWVIISYQTNGDCPGEEILVPENAVTTLWQGINYFSIAFRPNVSGGEKREAKRVYDSKVGDLEEFLMPIDAEAFIKASSGFAKW